MKAAILSTYKDDPCGKCPVKSDSSEERSEEKEIAIKPNKTTNSIPDRTEEDDRFEMFNVATSSNQSTEKSKLANTTENIFFNNMSDTTNSSELLTPTEESENVLSRPINLTAVIEESFEVPLSWSTTSDHSFLNSKNNYGNDIEDSLTNFKKNESQPVNSSTVLDDISIEIQNRTTDEMNFIPTHRSPAIDEIIDIELSENPEKSMYWQKHIKQKKNKKEHEKKNEIKILPSTTPIPIRIIFRDSHKHSEEKDNSEFVVLKTNDPSYHGHLDGKSYYYKEEIVSDEKFVPKSEEIRKIIPGRFNIEEGKEKAENIPWYYDSNESWTLKLDNEVQKGPEDEAADDLVQDKEKNRKIQQEVIAEIGSEGKQNAGGQEKSESDDKLVSHYSKLLYWVNYSI